MEIGSKNPHSDHSLFDRDAAVTGCFSAGLTVRNGSTVKVRGYVSGPVSIERGSVLEVQGCYDSSDGGELAGPIVVAGMLQGDLGNLRFFGGSLLLHPGSLVEQGDHLSVLDETGTIRPSRQNEEVVTSDKEGLWAFDPKFSTFKFFSQSALIALDERTPDADSSPPRKAAVS